MGEWYTKIWFINGVDNVNWPPYTVSISVRWLIYIINSVDKPNFQGIYSLTCLNLGKHTSDCLCPCSMLECIGLLSARTSFGLSSLRDHNEWLFGGSWAGWILSFPRNRNPFKDLDYSSSEDEGPHDKAAQAGVRLEENLILSNELIKRQQLKI